MSQPRYEKEYREIAKREGRPLFTIDIDRRHLPKGEGGRKSRWGVCTEEIEKLLLEAYRK